MNSLPVIIVSAALLQSCAKPAHKIEASIQAPDAYASLDCTQLATHLKTANYDVAQFTKQQDQARTNDTIGVLLIGIPTGSLTGGDREAQLAESKGRKIAIHKQIKDKNCK